MARIAIDLHGGDFGPSIIIPSSFQFFRDNPQHYGVLIGDSRQYRHFVHQSPDNIEWIESETLGDAAHKPSKLLRQEGFSSIEIAYKVLSRKDVDVLVSAEHTGVLMVLMAKYGAMHSLVERPVLVSWVPAQSKKTLMLDLGASFNANHVQLLTYAAIGAGLLQGLDQAPSLALLNVGTEYFKGPTELRLAHTRLEHWRRIDYRGFVEASDVFKGNLDIVVCDGFTGNSIIKASEGAVNLVLDVIRDQFSKSWLARVAGWFLRSRLQFALRPLDPRNANGALLAGSDLSVVKSHGNAGERAFMAALDQAVGLHGNRAVQSVWQALDRLLDEDLEAI
ncbi:MAG: hypothetical protein P8X89_02080 [Reinekea sp.]